MKTPRKGRFLRPFGVFLRVLRSRGINKGGL